MEKSVFEIKQLWSFSPSDKQKLELTNVLSEEETSLIEKKRIENYVWDSSNLAFNRDSESYNNKEYVRERDGDIIKTTIDLIEKSPDIHFLVSANWNILKNLGWDTKWQFDYSFDSEKQKFISGSPYWNDGSLNMDPFMWWKKEETLFKEKWKYFRPKKTKTNQKGLPLNIISAKWPHGRLGKYADDHRPATHLTMAIAYRNDDMKNMFKGINNKTLEGFLKDPANSAWEDFFRDLFSSCAHKYFPEYWKDFISNFNKDVASKK